MENLYFIPGVLMLLCFLNTGIAEGRVSCTFDFGLCGWTITEQSDFRWRNQSGQTDDRSSGPLNDHTCNNIMGTYLYITGNDVEYHNRVADMQSGSISLAENTTLTFWYHMNGVGIGSLSLSRISGRNESSRIWIHVGRQRGGWMQATVPLFAGKFKLKFEGTAKRHFGCDIAIDDIKLLSESQEQNDLDREHCKLPPTTSTTTTKSTTPTTPTTTRVLRMTTDSSYPDACANPVTNLTELSGSCDFEHGLCGYTIIPAQNDTKITWVNTDKVDKYSTAIETDHTSLGKINSGHYMRFQERFTWGGSGNNFGSFESPVITSTYVCLNFWYATPGPYSNLNVSILYSNGDMIEIWRTQGKVDGWKQANVPIYSDDQFTVVFQTSNTQYPARVGVDDILILGANVTGPDSTEEPGSSSRQTKASALVSKKTYISTTPPSFGNPKSTQTPSRMSTKVTKATTMPMSMSITAKTSRISTSKPVTSAKPPMASTFKSTSTKAPKMSTSKSTPSTNPLTVSIRKSSTLSFKSTVTRLPTQASDTSTQSTVKYPRNSTEQQNVSTIEQSSIRNYSSAVTLTKQTAVPHSNTAPKSSEPEGTRHSTISQFFPTSLGNLSSIVTSVEFTTQHSPSTPSKSKQTLLTKTSPSTFSHQRTQSSVNDTSVKPTSPRTAHAALPSLHSSSVSSSSVTQVIATFKPLTTLKPKATVKHPSAVAQNTTVKIDTNISTTSATKKHHEVYSKPEKQTGETKYTQPSIFAGVVVGSFLVGSLIGIIGHLLYTKYSRKGKGHQNNRVVKYNENSQDVTILQDRYTNGHIISGSLTNVSEVVTARL